MLHWTRTCRLGVLTPHTKAPEVPKTAMGSNFFQALEIVSKFRVNVIGEDLGVLAIYDILLSVEEPCRNLKLSRTLDDVNEAFKFVRVELASARRISKPYLNCSQIDNLTVY